MTKCFLCDKPLKGSWKGTWVAYTREDPKNDGVYVGPDCYKKIHAAGEEGYQATPWINGIRLYVTPILDEVNS